jgi:hypothetical protein
MAAVSSKRTTRAGSRDDRPEPIRPGEILILPNFLTRTLMRDAAWAQVKRQCAELGIQIASVVGRQVYVSTDAWIEFLKARPVRVPKKCTRKPREKSGESRKSDLVSAADGPSTNEQSQRR